MTDTIEDANFSAALALAGVGFRTFPAQAIYNPNTGGWNKPSCTSDWQLVATTDLGQIRRLWKRFPHAIPAVLTERIVVIDADRHRGGRDGVRALTDLADRHREWPDHPVVQTPSDGQHHYFAQPDPPLGNGRGGLPEGIDVRGVGGYAIGVGAVRPDGKTWHLLTDYIEPPPLPRWLKDLILPVEAHQPETAEVTSRPVTPREERYAQAALRGCIAEVEYAPRGRRNAVLNSVAYRLGRMVRRGWLDRREVESSLLAAAHRLRNDDGLTAVQATINSGLNAGERNPHPDLVDREWGRR